MKTNILDPILHITDKIPKFYAKIILKVQKYSRIRSKKSDLKYEEFDLKNVELDLKNVEFIIFSF